MEGEKKDEGRLNEFYFLLSRFNCSGISVTVDNHSISPQDSTMSVEFLDVKVRFDVPTLLRWLTTRRRRLSAASFRSWIVRERNLTR